MVLGYGQDWEKGCPGLVNDNWRDTSTLCAEVAEKTEDSRNDSVSGGMIGLSGSGHRVGSAGGVARSFVGRDIDGAVVKGSIVLVVFVEKRANVIPARTDAGMKFLFGSHAIGQKQGATEIGERGGFSAAHATGGNLVGKTGERVLQIDLRNTSAHEGLEQAKKNLLASRRTGGVMKAEAVVGGMSRLGAAASVREGEAAERSVGKIDALARHTRSITIGKDKRKYLEGQKTVIELGSVRMLVEIKYKLEE